MELVRTLKKGSAKTSGMLFLRRINIWDKLPESLNELIIKIALWCFNYKAKRDYRRLNIWARRMGEQWTHQEAALVIQIEHLLQERGTS